MVFSHPDRDPNMLKSPTRVELRRGPMCYSVQIRGADVLFNSAPGAYMLYARCYMLGWAPVMRCSRAPVYVSLGKTDPISLFFFTCFLVFVAARHTVLWFFQSFLWHSSLQ